MSQMFRRASATLAVILGLTLAPAASAETFSEIIVDLPEGPVSCEAANAYWTNEADFNEKIEQARVFAQYDARGPQIIDALMRIDEAATRCGLRTGQPIFVQTAAAQPAQDPTPSPEPAPEPAPAPVAEPAALNSSVPAPQVPTFQVVLPGGHSILLPDLQRMVFDFLAQFGFHFK